MVGQLRDRSGRLHRETHWRVRGIDGTLRGVAVLAVLLILVVVYRSPLLPIVVLLGAVVALAVASGMVYLLADHGALTFIVAFGVLLDTLVVRSLLVPALVHELGAAVWWPGRLGRADD